MKKNLVVIGYGGMGTWHTQHALKSDVVELVGIYDIKEEKCALARERGIFAYDSLEAVLNDPKVDLVTVAIPNDSHKEVVIKALEAGKNVICEKPVAMNLAELDEMIAAAEKSGKVTVVAVGATATVVAAVEVNLPVFDDNNAGSSDWEEWN